MKTTALYQALCSARGATLQILSTGSSCKRRNPVLHFRTEKLQLARNIYFPSTARYRAMRGFVTASVYPVRLKARLLFRNRPLYNYPRFHRFRALRFLQTPTLLNSRKTFVAHP